MSFFAASGNFKVLKAKGISFDTFQGYKREAHDDHFLLPQSVLSVGSMDEDASSSSSSMVSSSSEQPEHTNLRTNSSKAEIMLDTSRGRLVVDESSQTGGYFLFVADFRSWWPCYSPIPRFP